jgi:adenylate cyclase
MPDRSLRIGFRTSIIAIFVGTVLFVGLSLVYLSFERVGAITRTAAASFLDTVAQLSADRIDAQFMAVRDGLDILQDLPSVRSAAVRDNPRLYALLASMLRNNRQLYSLYAGYDDGRFVQMDYLERGGETARLRTEAPDGAQFRLVVIPDSGGASTIDFLRDDLSSIKRRPGPTDYDPRRRPWYTGAFEKDLRPLTEPYIFFAIGQPGYTLRMPIAGSPRGVVAGDILTGEAEALLRRQQLGRSGMVVLFDDENRVLAHPQISELMARNGGTAAEVVLPKLADVDRIGIARAIDAWKKTGSSQQIFEDAGGRVHAAAFRTIASAGPANLRLAVSAPVDEFYSQIEAERRRLFLTALGFVLAVLPIVLWMGTMMSKRMRALAVETDSIRHFDLLETPRIRSVVREIDDLGRSIAAMKNLVRTFSNFIPKRLVRELVESEVPIELGGERRELTILFTDVENFTSLTEAAEPTSVMRMTSRYFSVLSEEIMARQGTVDKFIGDAVMAFWNAPNEDERHVSNACRAVVACVEANRRLNVDFAAEGLPPFRTRFGLHVGDVVVGNIGSRDRMNYTALGASVNLAARLEGLNKQYGTTVLVSEAVQVRVADEFLFRSIDRISPKGFAAKFQVYELICARTDATDKQLAWVAEWEHAYAALPSTGKRNGNERLGAFLIAHPDDAVARHHANE